MRIGIFSNLERDTDGTAAKTLSSVLKGRGHEVYVWDQLACLNIDAPALNKNDLAKAAEAIVVLGGDGTVLRIAKECALYRTLIIAINFGRLGFLSEVETLDELDTVFEQIEKGDFYTESRGILDVSFGGKTYKALNEVALARGRSTKVIRFAIKVNGSTLNSYSADGVIVCTPTGSTAYSLSAGGPVVAPEVNAMIITPVCPHSLNSRSYIISDDSEVTIELTKSDGETNLNIDGDDLLTLSEGDIVKVKRSELSAQFIRLKKYNYYRKLLAKMSTLG
ncbi:MAG: NAD(+)/NADH kinase [Clostridiales bacterium]|jgi:NAD+ kinase|nr:NAD(+)/NADH kinase [Clostridiales bacterium]HOK81452.1 NAD(+)/NADH kinase [Clostridia bacterium]HOL60752.1 NAD(+)/NADH kinase [Clostridia bacterium]HPO53327.1 NAD(+)/NADH kinase [Clostridia bacterium]